MARGMLEYPRKERRHFETSALVHVFIKAWELSGRKHCQIFRAVISGWWGFQQLAFIFFLSVC